MPEMAVWGVIAAIGLLTFALRASFLAGGRAGTLSPMTARTLRYVPVAVLAALIFPALLQPTGPLDLSAGNVRLLAGVTAGVIGWRSGNALVTVAAGIIAFWVLQAVLR